MIDLKFWQGKRVFLTGHTGFKGSWFCLLLNLLGAKVTGYAIKPQTSPNLFDLTGVNELIRSIDGDAQDFGLLKRSMQEADPEVVIHLLSAQPNIRRSYEHPVEYYATNVMGTVNFFEAVRACKNVKAVINIATDKVYHNTNKNTGYSEEDPLGGYDPYSSSKACGELVTSAYRSSYFNPDAYQAHGVAVASARAGNVIAGGDFTPNRLIPDFVRTIMAGNKILIRNPHAIRPWQHVLEALDGYLLLVQKLYENGAKYAQAWNFGPDDKDAKPVEWIVKKVCAEWGSNASYEIEKNVNQPFEVSYLKLDSSKAKALLGWHPKWTIDQSIAKVVEWTKAYLAKEDLRQVCSKQIEEYLTIVD